MEKVSIDVWENAIKEKKGLKDSKFLYLIDKCILIECEDFLRKHNSLSVNNWSKENIVEDHKIFESFRFQEKEIIHTYNPDGRCKFCRIPQNK